jgi:hypothetical protein
MNAALARRLEAAHARGKIMRNFQIHVHSGLTGGGGESYNLNQDK